MLETVNETQCCSILPSCMFMDEDHVDDVILVTTTWKQQFLERFAMSVARGDNDGCASPNSINRPIFVALAPVQFRNMVRFDRCLSRMSLSSFSPSVRHLWNKIRGRQKWRGRQLPRPLRRLEALRMELTGSNSSLPVSMHSKICFEETVQFPQSTKKLFSSIRVPSFSQMMTNDLENDSFKTKTVDDAHSNIDTITKEESTGLLPEIPKRTKVHACQTFPGKCDKNNIRMLRFSITLPVTMMWTYRGDIRSPKLDSINITNKPRSCSRSDTSPTTNITTTLSTRQNADEHRSTGTPIDTTEKNIPLPQDFAKRTRCYKLNLDSSIPRTVFLGPFRHDIAPAVTYESDEETNDNITPLQIALNMAKIFREVKVDKDGTILALCKRAKAKRSAESKRMGTICQPSKRIIEIENAEALAEESIRTGKVTLDRPVNLQSMVVMGEYDDVKHLVLHGARHLGGAKLGETLCSDDALLTLNQYRAPREHKEPVYRDSDGGIQQREEARSRWSPKPWGNKVWRNPSVGRPPLKPRQKLIATSRAEAAWQRRKQYHSKTMR